MEDGNKLCHPPSSIFHPRVPNDLAFPPIASGLALLAADLPPAPWLGHTWPPFHVDEPLQRLSVIGSFFYRRGGGDDGRMRGGTSLAQTIWGSAFWIRRMP